MHQAQIVGALPALGQPAGDHPENDYPRHSYSFAGRLYPHKLPSMGPAHRVAHRDLIFLGDQILDLDLPPSTIAKRMTVARGTMTGILDSLQRRGLIRRIPHEEDGRRVLVEMTAEGAAGLMRLHHQLHRAEKRVMECLTESQQRSLLRILAVLQAHLLDKVLAASPARNDHPARPAGALRARTGSW